MTDQEWFAEYFSDYIKAFDVKAITDQLFGLKEKMVVVNEAGGKVMFAGNGGSAGIASHCAVDFSKNAGIRAMCFNEAGLITCLANDYGYAHWVAKAIEIYGDAGDMAVLISSSGQSENMLRAAEAARQLNMPIVTFTGFDDGNPLKKRGDINFWVDSRAYNIVEMTHQIWLLSVCDAIIGKVEYSTS